MSNNDTTRHPYPSKLSKSRNTSSYLDDPLWNPPPPKVTPFWINDPRALFSSTDLVSRDNMTNAERLNALTRVIVIISIIMFLVRFPLWWLFLLIGLIFVIILFYMEQRYWNKEYLRKPSIVKKVPRIIEYVDTKQVNLPLRLSGRGR